MATTKNSTKIYPKLGDQVYLRQFTRDYYVDLVKRPYTVVGVNENSITVQAAKLIYPVFHYDPKIMTEYYKQFDGHRVCFYDSVAESIEPDPNGQVKVLTWHPKKSLWGTPEPESYFPEYMIAGEGYVHFPFLDWRN